MPAVDDIAVFVRVAEARSFTAASQRLGVSPSAASKCVMRLEERLGVRLLNRTTRSVSLTEDGTTFFERCRQILAEIEDAEIAVTHAQQRPRGRLRVLAPAGFGRGILVPVLARFAQHYPELVVDVEFSGREADLVEEGIDVLVRIGDLRDSRLVARKLCDIRYVTVASPDYLARHGEPRTPADLAQHQCLGHLMPHTNRYREWRFAEGRRRTSRAVSGRLNMNDGAALLEAAIHGAGIATAATFLVAPAVHSGALRVVLREHVAVGPAVWVAFLAQRQLSSRIRAFVDFLAAEIPLAAAEAATLDDR